MKYLKNLTLLCCTILFMASCNEDASAVKQEVENTPEAVVAPVVAPAITPTTVVPTQSAGAVMHYTCIKGCAGGADAAVNCEVCGTLLVHNQAFHNQATTTQTNGGPVATPPAAEPSQNAAGIWHYTCATGCSGGSGTAGSCNSCGGALAHNTAYHQ